MKNCYRRRPDFVQTVGFLAATALLGCGSTDSAVVAGVPNTEGVDQDRSGGLLLSPEAVTLVPGELFRFSATPQAGGELAGPIVWSTSGGELDTEGWLRAPDTEGEYVVKASDAAGRSGLAMVRVQSLPGPYFNDSFDSCALTRTSASPGFAWTDSRGGATGRPVVSSAIAHSGTCSLRFTFVVGGPGADAWSEQRFTMGKRLTELYMQWYQYWPDGRESPSVGPRFYHRKDKGPNNNKLLRLWDEDYNHYHVKLGFSTLPRNGGDSELIPEYGTNQGGVGSGVTGRELVSDATRGRWVRIQIHARLASAANNDGLLEFWVDGNRVMAQTGLKLYPGALRDNFLRQGYLMGWANSGFNQPTTVYIDDVVIAGTPIPQ